VNNCHAEPEVLRGSLSFLPLIGPPSRYLQSIEICSKSAHRRGLA
jgi:hypothetical protein